MAGIRDIRNTARASLHEAMHVEAIHIAASDSTETAVKVRIHHRTQAFGDMTGFDFDPAQRIERVPEVVALAADITPARGDVFSILAGEAYTVEVPLPVDGITITCQCTRMSASEAAGLSVPGG